MKHEESPAGSAQDILMILNNGCKCNAAAKCRSTCLEWWGIRKALVGAVLVKNRGKPEYVPKFALFIRFLYIMKAIPGRNRRREDPRVFTDRQCRHRRHQSPAC